MIPMKSMPPMVSMDVWACLPGKNPFSYRLFCFFFFYLLVQFLQNLVNDVFGQLLHVTYAIVACDHSP